MVNDIVQTEAIDLAVQMSIRDSVVISPLFKTMDIGNMPTKTGQFPIQEADTAASITEGDASANVVYSTGGASVN